MPHHDPTERRLSAQIAAETSWANTPDRMARTQPGRDAYRAKFLAQVDTIHPPGTLTAAERERAAEHLFRAEMRRLSLNAVKARRLAREAREAAQRTTPKGGATT